MLYPIKINNKYGFIDSVGNVAIVPQYDLAYQFSCGCAVVAKGDKVGVINESNELVIPFIFARNSTHYCYQEDMFFAAGYGFFNTEGDLKIKLPNFASTSFTNGYAPVWQNLSWGKSQSLLSMRNPVMRCGMIDTSGNIIIPPEYDRIGFFSENLCPVCKEIDNNGVKKKLWGFVNTQNEIVEDFKYGCWGGGFKENRIAVWLSDDDKLGYIDSDFQVKIPFQFRNAGAFNEGMAVVQNNNYNGYSGYCNLAGEICIPCKFAYANSFSGDLAVVSSKRKWGFIDKNGEFVISPQFTAAFDFYHGLGSVLLNKSQQAYITKTGEIIFTCEKLY